MTFREKLAKEHPECMGGQYWAGCMKCPCNYGYEEIPASEHCENMRCTECWDREMPGEIPTEKTYEEGLQDAWELAKKIAIEKSNGGFDVYEIAHIFGFNDTDAIFMYYTPQEALAKLKAYEEEKEIKVGDVVEIIDPRYDNPDIVIKGCVIGIYDLTLFYVLEDNGNIEEWRKEKLKKTGKHIDIESLLGQIRGAE